MRINADFSRRAVVRPEDYRWVDSPMRGVERIMLDRVGDEVARATSLVRYAPDSTFAEHVHGGGEEFLVLEGVFGDEHRDYPSGTYVRNPIGTRHSPRVGHRGCLIFVKLQQFDPGDDVPVAIDTRTAAWGPGNGPGCEQMSLHQFGDERVALVRLSPGSPWQTRGHAGGEEIFVMEGAFRDEHGEYPAGSWLRDPRGARRNAAAGAAGALLYRKTGHLPPSQ